MSVSTLRFPARRPGMNWRFKAALGLAAVVLLFLAWRANNAREVKASLAAIHKAGYPASMVELQRMYYPPVKPEDNAATFFTEALGRLKRAETAVPGGIARLDSRFPRNAPPFSPADIEKATNLLSFYQEALNGLLQSPATNICRYPLDFSQGLEMSNPFVKKAGDAVRLLLLRALIDVDTAGPEAATADLEGALRLSQSFAGEPTWEAFRARSRCRAMTMACLEYVLNRRQFTEIQLARLARAFQSENDPRGTERVLLQELCGGIDVFQTPPEAKNSRFSAVKANRVNVDKLMKWSGLADRDFSQFLGVMAMEFRANKLPFPERLEEGRRLSHLVRDLSSESKFNPFFYSAKLLSAITDVHRLECNNAASLLLIQTVLAIERYRSANENRLPPGLEALTPSFLSVIPADPFDGRPIRFKLLAVGYLVYSTGEDQTDHGGKEYQRSTFPFDVTFTIER